MLKSITIQISKRKQVVFTWEEAKVVYSDLDKIFGDGGSYRPESPKPRVISKAVGKLVADPPIVSIHDMEKPSEG